MLSLGQIHPRDHPHSRMFIVFLIDCCVLGCIKQHGDSLVLLHVPIALTNKFHPSVDMTDCLCLYSFLTLLRIEFNTLI